MSTDHLPTGTASQVAALGTILSIWAHPDDETYLAGGLMAAAADAGQRVVCVTATAGEHGTDDPETWPPERLGEVRRAEAAAAMSVLGVREHRVVGLPDGGLADLDAEGIAAVEALIDEVVPDTILTFGPDGITFHPDHVAVHRWVTAAWRRRGGGCSLLQAAASADHLDRFGEMLEEWGVYMDDRRPVGVPTTELALRLCLSGPDLERKLDALRAMPSQTAGAMTSIDPDLFAAEIAEESFVAATLSGADRGSSR